MSQFFVSGGQSIGVSASTSVLLMNTQDWCPSGWTGWISLQSKGLSRVFSNTTAKKHQFFGTQLCLLLALYWTGTWWSGDDDERVKEGKRLVFPGVRSRPSRSRESAGNTELERQRKKQRQTDTGIQALMELRCFTEFCKSICTSSFFR